MVNVLGRVKKKKMLSFAYQMTKINISNVL